MGKRSKLERKQEKARRAKLAWVAIPFGLFAAFGAWGATVDSPYPAAWLFLFSWLFFIWAAWAFLDRVRRHLKIILLILAVSLGAVVDYEWLHHKTRPSFVFLAPAAWLNGDTWDFVVNHRGPRSCYGVNFLFVDDDRRNHLARSQSAVSPADIDSFQRQMQIQEVNPKGRGTVFARQFLWKPFAPSFSHFTVEITWRDGRAHEEIQIARVADKWAYAIYVIDPENKTNLLRCHDQDFPSTERLPPCFPAINQVSD